MWRKIVFALLLCCVAPLVASIGQGDADAGSNTTGVLVGAIRWDAWNGDNPSVVDDVGEEVEESLGPNHWHYRLPFYATEVNTNEVNINSNSQTVMDQEIAYAKNAGLDYWAFVTYPTSGGDIANLTNSLNLYLSSTHKSDINFAALIESGWLLHNGTTAQQEINRYVAYFGMAEYKKVLGGRPLMYVFNPSSLVGIFGSWSAAATFFQNMENASISAGYGEPYFVAMGSNSDKVNLGFDAISDYAFPGGNSSGQSYASHVSGVESQWNSEKSYKLIPTVSAGWDHRPRYENPTTWDSGSQNYVQSGTPTEIASHLDNAIQFVKNNPTDTPANAVLIYAWNEFDEGGWIAPTLYYGTDRLDAIANVLHPVIGSDGPNLALSRTYSSSSQWDASQTASKAFDGSQATNWQSVSGSGFNGQWLEVNFGGNVTFDKAVISEYGDRTSGYRIEYWNGSSWQTAYNGTTIGTSRTVTFAEVTGSKARIYYTSGSNTPIVYEFALYNVTSNLALGKTYSSSSQWDASQAASYAFDGNQATNWQSVIGSGFNGQWLEVSFGTNTAFDKAIMSEYGNRAAGYRIEYWNGSSWQTAYTGTTIGTSRTVTFTEVTGSKARIYFTSGTYTPIIYEFELYNQ